METIHLDLPALAGALSRRLRAVGVPTTPEGSADLARALELVRPLTRRRLYWTARSVCVSDRAHVPAFDTVFAAVFGGPVAAEAAPLDGAPTVPVAPDERPVAERARSADEAAPRDPHVRPASAAPRASGKAEAGAEVEVPLAGAQRLVPLGRLGVDQPGPDQLAVAHEEGVGQRAVTPVEAVAVEVDQQRGDGVEQPRPVGPHGDRHPHEQSAVLPGALEVVRDEHGGVLEGLHDHPRRADG